MDALTWLIILGVLILASLITGIVFLVKYFRIKTKTKNKTKSKKFLWIGIALTFVVPGVLIYLIYRIAFQPQITCYIPVSVMPPESASAALLLYRKGLLKDLSDRLPKNVVQKVSKK